ncbi:unnamed protein product [Mytilus coruscus]|uniref:Uncharacterized protein n=1 Tax=Mytilus coruscus TaxID=42192 RepID=A0A6J8E0U0_MYTCO|nr:unnamed protein product [Mytilus coruscus]
MQFIGVGAEDPKLHICIGPELFYKISVSNTTLKTPFVILKVSVYVETIPSANDRFYSTDQLIVIRIMVVLWIMCFLVSVILVQFIGVGAEDPKLHICIGPELFYKISVSNTTLKTLFVILKVTVCVETIPSANDRMFKDDDRRAFRYIHRNIKSSMSRECQTLVLD